MIYCCDFLLCVKNTLYFLFRSTTNSSKRVYFEPKPYELLFFIQIFLETDKKKAGSKISVMKQ